MITWRLLYKILILATVFLLVGCGFHLRQPKPLPPNLKVLYLETTSPYSTASIQLRQLLDNMQIQLVSNRKAAPVTLFVFGENFISTTVSKSASAKTQQYRLEFVIEYELQDEKGNIIFGPRQLSNNRIYTVQEDQILSSSNETDTLHREMQQDSVYQIINSLSSPSVAQAMSDYEIKTRTTTTASH